MKTSKKLLSLLLAFLFVLQPFPISYLGNVVIKAFASENFFVAEKYSYQIPKQSENTVNTVIPETFTINDSATIERDYDKVSDHALSLEEERYFDIVHDKLFFSELNSEEKAFLCNYVLLSENEFELLENRGYSINDSANLSTLAEDSYTTVKEIIDMNLSAADMTRILDELYKYIGCVKDKFIGTDDDIMIRQYFLENFSCNEIIVAYGLSKAFDVNIDDLLTKYLEQITNFSIIENNLVLTEDEKLGLIEVASFFNLQESSSENEPQESVDNTGLISTNSKDEKSSDNSDEITQDDYLTININADIAVTTEDNNVKQITDIVSVEIDSIVDNYSSSTSTSTNTQYDCLDFLGSPYYYDYENENVILNTGNLEYSHVDYVIPGVNGLDLVIERRYSAQESNYYIPKGYMRYNDGESSYYNMGYGNYYNRKMYALGNGWTFAFSAINLTVSGDYLYLSDGRSFTISSSNSLEEYILDDLVFSTCEETIGDVGNATYKLVYQDGKTEYFSQDGRLICIENRFGNRITFKHSVYNGLPHIIITDTLNNEIIISGVNTSNGHTMRISLPNDITLSYDVEYYDSFSSNYSQALAAYHDAENNVTNYSYEVATSYFDVFGQLLDGINYYINLTTITHPTLSQTIFEYENELVYLGTEGGTMYIFQLKSRKDIIGTTICNHNQYTYFRDYTGESILVTPGELPENYYYSTTVTQNGVNTTTTFDNKHSATNIVSITNDKKIEEKIYEYNSDKLPTKEIIRQYNSDNSTYIESVYMMEYDENGNITAKWSSLADGIKSDVYKTSYTYNSAYYLPTLIEYYINNDTKVTIQNTLCDSNKTITSTEVLVNNSRAHYSEFSYDIYGNVLTEKVYGSNSSVYELTEYAYQDGAYLIQEKHSSVKTSDGAFALGTSGTADGIITCNYTYDNLGRMTSSKDGKGNTTTYTNDDLGNVTSITNPDNTTVTYTRNYANNYVIVKDENNNQIKYTYTPLGLEYETIDVSSGNVITRKEYDNSSRLVKAYEYVYGSVTEYTYDCLDRITSETVKQGDTVLSQTLYSYEYAVENGTYNKVTKTIVGDTNAPSIVTTEYTDKHGNVAKTGKIINGVEYFDTYTYDYVGNCTSVLSAADAAKNLTYTSQYEYDHNGQVTKTYNANGQYTANTYDAFGRLISATDYAGTPTTYTYDTLGRLTSQTITIEEGVTSTSKYEYDAAGNIIREWSQNNAVGSTADWAKTEYAYDNRNRLTLVKQYNGDSVAVTTAYTYDGVGNTLSMTSGGKTTTYTYDRFGNVLTEKNALNQTETYTYGILGKLESKTDRNGMSTAYFYDALGRTLAVSASNGTKTETQTYTYTKTGQILTETNANGSTTYTYDELGRVVSVHEQTALPEPIYKSISITKAWIDTLTNHSEVTATVEVDGEESARTVALNAENDWTVTFSDIPVASNVTITEENIPEGYVVNYSCENNTYTIANISINPETGVEHVVSLDANGGDISSESITVTNGNTYNLPTPTRTGYTFNGWYYGETLINNGDTIALAENATFTASWTGNPYTITFHFNKSSSNATETQVLYYGVETQLMGTSFTLPGFGIIGWSTTSDGEAEYARYANILNVSPIPNNHLDLYAIWSKIAGSIVPVDPSPEDEIMSPGDGSEETTETEENLETELTPDVEPKTETEITSDEEIGEVTGVGEDFGLSLTSDAGEPIENDATMELEPVSEPVIEEENTEEPESTPETEAETESNSGIGLELVESGTLELTEVAETTSTPDISALEDVVYCKTYTYDLAGNRTGFTLEKGDEIVHNIVYTYDNLNRLSTVKKNGTVEATYTYDTNGNRASLTYANGVVTTYSYNLANWVTSVSNKTSEGEIISKYSYSYYTSGNQKRKAKAGGSTTYYTYDDLGRLKQESESTGLVVKYTYNASGNRILMRVTGTENYNVSYIYNAANQLTAEGKTVDGVLTITEYTYDANGNTLTVTSPDSIQVNTYDSFNRLVEINVNGNHTSYIYNTAGIRTAKSTDGIITAFLLDGGNVVGEVQSGEVTATYLRGANLISRKTDTTEQYYVFNAHGDVTGLVNNSQTVEKRYDYDAFGNEKEPSATDANPFRYCGEYFDKETGTYYLRARYYDPSIGRFTSQDSVRYSERSLPTGNVIDPLSLNYYTYCGNNPILYKDPSGHFFETAFDLVSLGFSIADVYANPYDPMNWIGLAGDAIDLFPFVTGVGEVTRAVRMADNFADSVDAVNDTKKGFGVLEETIEKTSKNTNNTSATKKVWQVGDDINAPTKSGKDPAWSTVRQRYWKNEAANNPEIYKDPKFYTEDSLSRMHKGLAPKHYGADGKAYSMELHHKKARHEGGTHDYSNLEILTPWDHAKKDKFRHFSYSID